MSAAFKPRAGCVFLELYIVFLPVIACVVLVTAYGQVAFWLISAYEQGQRMREHLFRNMIRQNIGWFDTQETGELNTRLADDVNKIISGIGDKIGNFFQWFSTAVTGIIIGFVWGWKLTLVILAVGPLLAIGGTVMTKVRICGPEITTLFLNLCLLVVFLVIHRVVNDTVLKSHPYILGCG